MLTGRRCGEQDGKPRVQELIATREGMVIDLLLSKVGPAPLGRSYPLRYAYTIWTGIVIQAEAHHESSGPKTRQAGRPGSQSS